MAEYIDRDNAYFRCSYRGDCIGLSSDCERCTDNVIDYRDFMKIPLADVVEREKINEAKKIAEETISMCFKLGFNERADGMKEILEIFERVIGE